MPTQYLCAICGAKYVKDANYCHKCGVSSGAQGAAKTGGKRQAKGGAGRGKEEAKGPKIEVKCPVCGARISTRNIPLYCAGCKSLFCQRCEKAYRKGREPGEKPFCARCFPSYQALIKKLSMGTVVPK